jgi:hypothetical protein
VKLSQEIAPTYRPSAYTFKDATLRPVDGRKMGPFRIRSTPALKIR